MVCTFPRDTDAEEGIAERRESVTRRVWTISRDDGIACSVRLCIRGLCCLSLDLQCLALPGDRTVRCVGSPVGEKEVVQEKKQRGVIEGSAQSAEAENNTARRMAGYLLPCMLDAGRAGTYLRTCLSLVVEVPLLPRPTPYLLRNISLVLLVVLAVYTT